MCRSIKVLRRPGLITTKDELQAAALQYVRKISGFRKPSKVNQEAFDRAVREITEAGERLIRTVERDAVRRDASSEASLPNVQQL
jgi:hypothetical protein